MGDTVKSLESVTEGGEVSQAEDTGCLTYSPLLIAGTGGSEGGRS